MFSINHPKKTIILCIGILAVLFLHDTILDMALWLLHSIFELLHAVFEFSEHLLDLLIEHLFHTSPRATQIIVFYIMLSISAAAGFKLIQALSLGYGKFIKLQKDIWRYKKTKALIYWQNQALIEKIKWGIVILTGILSFSLWAFS